MDVQQLTAKTYALTHTERYSFGFSDGQQATADFLNHSPFNSACDPTGVHTTDGKHTIYYCDGWFKGCSTTWNNLAQANPPIPQPAQKPLKQDAEFKLPSTTSHVNVNVSSTSPSIRDTTHNATISIHTVNTVLGSNNNVLIQEEPILRKLIIANINNAVLMAEGSVKDNIPVSVKNHQPTGGFRLPKGLILQKSLLLQSSFMQ